MRIWNCFDFFKKSFRETFMVKKKILRRVFVGNDFLKLNLISVCEIPFFKKYWTCEIAFAFFKIIFLKFLDKEKFFVGE